MRLSSFHYLVRGIIQDGEYFLLCKQKGGNYTFLLGGHIEPFEKATDALEREIKEEIGADVTVGEFIGAIENAWEDNYEIGLHFNVSHSLTKDDAVTPASKDEEHLEFLWVHKDDISNANLLPPPCIDLIQTQQKPFWGSSM